MNLSSFQQSSLKTRVTVFTLIIFVLSIWSLAFYVSRMLRDDLQALLGAQQMSTVSALAKEANQEIGDRLKALQRVANAMTPLVLQDDSALQSFLAENHILLGMFNGGILAHRRDSVPIIEAPRSAGRTGADYMDIDTLANVLKDGEARIGRPVLDQSKPGPAFGMTAPIRDADGRVIGALSGVTLLGQPNFLNRITESHYGKTGGYLLIALQSRTIVSATDESRVFEVLPDPGSSPLIDRFLDGLEVPTILVDTSGEELLVSDKPVPLAGWMLSAVLPTHEAFAPIRAMQMRMLYTAALLTLMAGILTWLMLKRQLAPLLAAVQALASLSGGEPLQALPVSKPDEIGELVGGFNRLLNTLGQREKQLIQMAAELEAKVDERTQKLRQVSAQLTITEERERRLLAQDLHDNLGQLLAVIRIRMSSLMLDPNQDAFDNISGLLEKADQSARMITLQLSPPILQTLGLAATLEWLADEMERMYGLTVHLDFEQEIKPLTKEVLAMVYRSTRELLINVARHAGVGEASVFSKCDTERLTITVRDEGCGFDGASFNFASPNAHGFGLTAIQDRISNIGGEMEIDSRSGEGATITLFIPYWTRPSGLGEAVVAS